MDRKTLNLRITSAIIFAILFLGSIIAHRISFLVFFLFVAYTGGREYTRMQKRYERKIFKRYMGVMGGLIAMAPILIYFNLVLLNVNSIIYRLLLLISMILTVVVTIDMLRPQHAFLYRLPYQVSAFIYPGLFLASPVLVILDIEGNYQKYYLLVMIFSIWAVDVGAYFIGSLWGKHKLYPRLSPNKTIEGAIGGILAAVIIGYCSSWAFGISTSIGLLIGVSCGILGIIGDLYESKLKRTAMLKDSSRIMPGHGGILDRFDGFIIALPTVSIILWQALKLWT